MEKFYTPKDAADTFNLSEKTLKDWLRAGKVRGEKVGRSWRVSDRALRTYLKLPMELEKIDKIFIQNELERIQALLLDVEKGKKDGMERSEALNLVADLEEILQRIDRGKALPPAPQLMTRKSSPKISLEEMIQQTNLSDLEELIDETIEGLLEEEGYYVSLDNVTLIKDVIERDLKNRLSRRALRDIEELDKTSKEFRENPKATLADAFRLAACFRKVSEYL